MAKTKGEPVATSKPSKMTKKTTAKEAKETKPHVKEKNVPQVEKIQSKAKKDGDDDKVEVSNEKKLIALYSLQQIDSQVDKIRIIRGELPLEVQDLEDEIDSRPGNTCR